MKPGFGDSLRKLPLNPRAGAGLFRLTGHAAVQEGPAPGARRLGLVASDTTVEIVNQQNGFSYAATLPLAGWSFGGLVDVTRELDAGGSGVGTANRTGGRVRIEPAIGSTIIDRLTRGQTVSILDSRDGWFLIEVAPQAGWIANTLLRPVDRTGIDQLEATDDLAIVDGEASRIVPLPEEGASDSGAKDGADAGSMITVPTDAIVYAGPLPTSAPLGRLTSAVEGVRAATAGSGDNVNMLLIQRADKLSGWIFGSLVEVPESGAETGAGTVSVNRARVRLDPTTVRDNIITSLDRGTRVKIAGREGDWLRILLPAAAGYVAVTEP